MSINKSPLVSIKCTVYNHEPYLRQCLDGFVMQKTNFPFEAIVHDDASTDGSAAIIREYAEKYPDIIKPIYETENQYSKKDDSLGRIMNAAIHPDAKYIALCEGDDYWIDPLKLQKQIDFLEAQADYGLAYSKVKTYIHNTRTFTGFNGSEYKGKDALVCTNVIPTLSVVMRKDLYLQYLEEVNPATKGWMMGDFPMWIWFSVHSNIKYFDECFGVYRVLTESASHFTNPQKPLAMSLSSLSIKRYFVDRYWGKRKKEMDDRVVRYFYLRGRMLIAQHGGEQLNAESYQFFVVQKRYLSAWVSKLLYKLRKHSLLMRILIKLESFFIENDYKY